MPIYRYTKVDTIKKVTRYGKDETIIYRQPLSDAKVVLKNFSHLLESK